MDRAKKLFIIFKILQIKMKYNHNAGAEIVNSLISKKNGIMIWFKLMQLKGGSIGTLVQLVIERWYEHQRIYM